MNVVCIHRVSYDKPCEFCGRGGSQDCMTEIAYEMLWERLHIKRSYDDARILMKLTKISDISEMTGISTSKLRKMQKELEGELCKQDTSIPITT